MSCLNLRLPPAKKAWQSFTSKLQNQLHKLNKSKNIKKTYRLDLSVTVRPAVSFDQHDSIRRRRLFNPFKRRSSRKRLFMHKKNAPVYIDKLFRGPVADDEVVVDKCPSRTNTMKLLESRAVKVAEPASKQDEKGSGRDCQADDMWESLRFASPQMRGIDERAEQFIASFRAEMEVQQMMDFDLCIENGSSLS